MSDESENLTIQILRDIQAQLSDMQKALESHERRFERMQTQIDYRFDGVERKIGELIDASSKALGSAAVANVRHDSASVHFAEVELELRELRSRVKQLEEKV